MNHDNDNNQPGDLLIGAKAVGEALGISRRQVFHLIEKQLIPTFRLGSSVAARRSTLMRWLAAQEAA
ncbi:MAG: DNA-binding protein [Alphaproteobacteria bacterium]|nr:DNA-binding protein [Alphaproteobacteria bacterium]